MKTVYITITLINLALFINSELFLLEGQRSLTVKETHSVTEPNTNVSPKLCRIFLLPDQFVYYNFHFTPFVISSLETINYMVRWMGKQIAH